MTQFIATLIVFVLAILSMSIGLVTYDHYGSISRGITQ